MSRVALHRQETSKSLVHGVEDVCEMAGATETSASGWKVADKSWERVQVKTFTNWVNSHLRWREMKVNDLSQDFHDGVILSELLEQISGKVVPHKKEVKATDRHKKIDNLQNAVKFVAEFYKEAGVKITTSAEDLVDCKSGAILGMVWVIIHKFAVSGISEGSASAKEGLLLWAQRNTAGYAGVKVENFSTSWKDGLAFCALIHNLDKSLIDFASLKADEPAKNLELAFSIAEKVFDIPRLFDPEDVCDLPRPDEKSIMTYLASWWQKFSGMSRKLFNSHVLQKAVQEAMALSDMRASFIEQASTFEIFATKWAKLLSEPSNASSFRDLQAAFMEYDDFETSDFLNFDAMLMQIEVLGSSISRKLQAGSKGAFEPPANISVPTLKGLWESVKDKKSSYHDALDTRVSAFIAETFQHFDSDKTNTLRFDELKACFSALELDMSDDDIATFMAGLGYDSKAGASITLESFQSGMRQIMRFTMSDKSVSAALAAICKDSPLGAFVEEEVEKVLSPAEFAFLKKNPAIFAAQEAIIRKTGSPDETVTVSALQVQPLLEYLASV